ncbi:MAG: hypothetical protein Kow0074_25290 [Candidatus Zixiibacteriota bacterium]
MDTDRWKRVQELFDAAVDLSPAEREALLAQECRGDDELRAEVESLLAADAGAGGLLDGHAVDVIDVEAAPSREGSAIGPYRLVKEIGAGGMGTVYLAERADGQFRQKVALKVIRRGMDTEQILQRFAGERQILARLQHPNIARLFDGGMTDDGVPYFTMEYIDGEPIDQYCDRRRLTIDERLRLFLTVCDAVDYAHRNLVVHRDLKPGNMLVTDDGTLKLLDFGIAKVIGPIEDATQLKSITRTGARVMTPGYASPEQIRGDAVTTSTDVYSLGVVLYKLLTGLRPYAMTGDNPLEAERAVLMTDPNRPSTAVIALPEFTGADDTEVSASRLAEARHTTPERLRRRLSGDLDNICLMALRKEPDRRYASAGHLRDEIRRHLEGLPVEARPDTIGYRVSKFARRYRGAVVTSVAVLVMLIAVVTFYTIRLASERDYARASAERAETASRFLRGIFEVPSMGTVGGKLTVRELLDNGAERIEKELDGQPDLQAEMYAVLGDVSLGLGMYENALDMLARSIELKRELHNDPDADLGKTMYLAAAAAYELREFGAAETLYNEALTIERMIEPTNDSAVAGILNDLGALWRHQGQYAKAESVYTEALTIRRRIFGDRHPDVAHTLNHLGRLKYNQGEYAEAEPLLREALAIRRENYNPMDPEIGASLGSLAGSLDAMGRHGEALPLREEVWAIMDSALGPEHPYTFSSMSSLARTLAYLERYDTSEALLRTSLRQHREFLPPGSMNISSPLRGLGDLLTRTGRAPEAEPLLREALELVASSLPPTHYLYAESQGLLGACLVELGAYAEAESLLVQSHATLMEARPADDHMVRDAEERLERLYEEWGKPEKAQEYRL